MTPEEAIEYVAQQVSAELTENALDQWDGHPEIGEHDWALVVEAVDRRAIFPQRKLYDEAYALLSARAENDG